MKPLYLVAVLLAACTFPGSEQMASSTAGAPTTSTTRPTTTTSAPAGTTSTLEATPTLPTLALNTPAGVPVAVLAETAAGYIVRTTCGSTGYVSGGEPISEAAVVLDPGHGGPIDTGAVGPNGLMEKDINLKVSLATQEMLLERGFSVVVTRAGDYAVPLSNRTSFADHVGAELLVSIHHNSPNQQTSSSPGTEIFVQHGSPDSNRLGGLVWEHVVEALSVFDVGWTSARDAGVLSVLNSRGTDAYGINRLPETVSIIAELAYVSNQDEAALMLTDEYVGVAATGLASAIEAYLTTSEPGSGFAEEPRVFNPRAAVSADLCEEVDLD
jgi:N-acetylmuramoyl-L-alanine amidase